ncbi:formyltetrahydrofolate deformylase [Alcaligenes aquatilis]|uniref:Formyltetrahydrofolate deformylase n=2 Tax=Alcaligenes TaxID=507 RepID=A0ABY4NMX9_9BURK|nr:MULTISPECIES: formyltetrahydrofolate deformylase [Alcaligenes]MCC9163789.1 formyltetrahydrofolate deformylase [Alcaligenes sp. MMA]MCH4225876.1 formyltetrahydrofolate deformylase [Alcaligenes faecalis]QXR37828.1 formyltetrahydrofolate deformylase [Alcaligenes aquatilis]UQN37866.1 formyltetrahydrofolate deformylase [Alcaligenes aquatilis]UYY89111.1 formyltetrahydrofolate deformylase [Alcaligenes sp. SMD-FA]
MLMNDYILTLSCPDRTGIVHNVSGWLLEQNGNIVEAQQFGDAATNRFFLRIQFSLPEKQDVNALQTSFAPIAEKFSMDANIYDAQRKARLLILVSRQGHCLNDLLFRAHSGQLPVEIAAVASNHTDHAGLASSYGIPFHHLPVTPETRPQQEQQIIDLARDLKIDLVVLARYMQILSTNLCQSLSGRAINIHHSFLPSFKGARPYHQAHARGVKIIGATAHYVTADLDEGPIIEQDVEHVTHAVSPAELTQIGSDVESLVLARAVRAHVEHRILLNDQRTVVFR